MHAVVDIKLETRGTTIILHPVPIDHNTCHRYRVLEIEVLAWTVYQIEARIILGKSWCEKLHHFPKRSFFKNLSSCSFSGSYVTLFNPLALELDI